MDKADAGPDCVSALSLATFFFPMCPFDCPIFFSTLPIPHLESIDNRRLCKMPHKHKRKRDDDESKYVSVKRDRSSVDVNISPTQFRPPTHVSRTNSLRAPEARIGIYI